MWFVWDEHIGVGYGVMVGKGVWAGPPAGSGE